MGTWIIFKNKKSSTILYSIKKKSNKTTFSVWPIKCHIEK